MASDFFYPSENARFDTDKGTMENSQDIRFKAGCRREISAGLRALLRQGGIHERNEYGTDPNHQQSSRFG